jgi:hypothetical protein
MLTRGEVMVEGSWSQPWKLRAAEKDPHHLHIRG